MGSWRNPIFINTVAHSAGVLLFCAFLFLLVRNWRRHGLGSVRLPVIAALLALGWNAGSLLILAGAATAHRADVVTAVCFAVLSILPAVLLQVVAGEENRAAVRFGYVVSFCAVALHIAELFFPESRFHQLALLCVTIGFGALTAWIFAAGLRSGARTERGQALSLACLLLFTSSFLHFGYQHTSSPWAAEVTWHHLGIPVALILLLRDYRLLLLDTFLRFLVNFGLSALYVALVLAVMLKFHIVGPVRFSMFSSGVCVVAACLSLIAFAEVRSGLQSWMKRAIFGRHNVEECIRRIEDAASEARSEDELLAKALEQVAQHLRTDAYLLEDEVSLPPRARPASEPLHPEAEIPLRFSGGDMRRLLLGKRKGGQAYSSDDLTEMRVLGTAVAEQVERFRSRELRRLVAQAELRALQAQINPHFLFNALNTLYGTIDRRCGEARRMVLNLADIFRYFLQGQRTLIPLSEEIRIVEAYLEIESLRLGGRFTTQLLIPDSALGCLIPILSVQPLVENAIKHGITPKLEPASVRVEAERRPEGLRITVQDTGIGFAKSKARTHGGTGLGLENVRRRLTLSYGSAAALEIQSTDAGALVSFLVPEPAET